jgi:hypothetical protein
MFKIMPDATFCGKENHSLGRHGWVGIWTLYPKPHTLEEKHAQQSEQAALGGPRLAQILIDCVLL